MHSRKPARTKVLNLFAPELGSAQPSWRVLGLVLLGYEFLVAAAIALGASAGAACMAVRVTGSDVTPIDIRMGFWCEANHAPLYLLGIPVFYVFTFALIGRANTAFNYLERIGRLRNPANVPLSVVIGGRTKLWIALSAVILFGVLNLEFSSELRSLSHTEQAIERARLKTNHTPEDVVMGWVQAQYFNVWATLVQEKKIRNTAIEQIEQKEQHYTKVSVKQGGAEEHSRRFNVFLVLAIFVESIAISFGIWVLFKICWILFWTLCAYAWQPPWIEIVPFLLDPNKRFGLRQLDEVYKSMLSLVILAGLGYYLNISSNVSKGTSAISPGTHDLSPLWDLRLQLLFWMLPALAAGLVVTSPALAARALRAERQRLAYEVGALIAEAQRNVTHFNAETRLSEEGLHTLRISAELEETLSTLEEQRTWPKEDKVFYAQIGALIVFFGVLPLTVFASAAIAAIITFPGAIAPEEILQGIKELPEAINRAVEVLRDVIYALCGS
jgi:hypothetical protein